jgi:hypothetical protein
MFAAVSNVEPSLLLDGRLFDFRSLGKGDAGLGHEDAWLDEEGV